MTVPTALTPENTVLVVIDVQDRLFQVMHDKEKLLSSLERLIKGTQAMAVPVVLTEQYPKGLGPTLPEVSGLLPEVKPVEKVCFSCLDEDDFRRELEKTARRQVLLTGIEAHVCVYQTARDLLNLGYEVHVVADCISSREVGNKDIALQKMAASGASLTGMEMALFEMLRVAKGDTFKQISNIVK